MTQRDGTYDRIGLIGIQNGRRPMGVLFEARHVSRTEARQRPSKVTGSKSSATTPRSCART